MSKPRKSSKKTADNNQFLLGAVIVLFVFSIILSLKVFSQSDFLANLNFGQKSVEQTSTTDNKIYAEVSEKVLPAKGFQSKIALGDAALKLVENGVIDQDKFEQLYSQRGLPQELKDVLSSSSNKPILLTRENANIYLNLFWPLGLSNYLGSNSQSPINGEDLNNFASTGGWTLGKAQSGGEYFNKFQILKLTPEQETLAIKIAKNTYRPCCDNSTFFQDCNHGSALFGLLQLGASQGLNEKELYREALAFNSFWFPDNYVQTALLLKVKRNIDWENVDPEEILGFKYSAISQWVKNVQEEVAKIPDLLPKQEGGGSCGV